MFFKPAVVVASVFIGFAAATCTNVPTNLCCQSTASSTDAVGSALVELLGLDLTGIVGDLGLNCSPLTVVGNNCGDTTVTCTAPQTQCGLIAIGCIPITL
ncbi:Hydrophobin 2 [Mycena venus]|uniref:Hydrophobin n=1 Tax=Mycena venus TaxID=2733690 RepID=A0A8H7D384_9AGAR|nr:Hydrophobin 2 [Mycena venus]